MLIACRYASADDKCLIIIFDCVSEKRVTRVMASKRSPPRTNSSTRYMLVDVSMSISSEMMCWCFSFFITRTSASM